MLQLKQLNISNRVEWLVEKRYTFGAGSDNNYQVSGPDVSEIHAGLDVNGDSLQLANLGGGRAVTVNGKVIEKNKVLTAGDEFYIGDSGFKIIDPKLTHKAKPVINSDLVDWTLKAKNTALANKSFPIKGTMTIGRSRECDICLNVVHLSRRHAQLSVKDNHIQIDDLKSSNGTYLNGKKVTSATVRAGDEIGFDTLKFAVLGPSNALEKTHVRQDDSDADATTMRPIIREEDITPSGNNKPITAKSKDHKAEPVQSKVSSAPANSPPPNHQEIKPKNKSNTIILVVLGILIVSAASYVMLG